MLETIDGGQTWAAHPSPFSGSLQQVTCPGPTTCYAAAGYTVVKTTDGFRQISQTPAKSPIGGAQLGQISCPTAATCYANTFESDMVTTADGGKTWTIMSGRPMNYLRCPTSTRCYGFVLLYPGNGNPPRALLYRSTDGAKSWQQFAVPVHAPAISTGVVGGLACVGEATCYVLAMTSVNARPTLGLFVTTDGGATWSAEMSINGKTAPGNLESSDIACPSASTCFVALGHGSGTPGETMPVSFLKTANAGMSWTSQSAVPCAESCDGIFPRLECPTVQTCYVVRGDVAPSSSPTQVMVTHDAGVRWRSAQVSKRGFLADIACPDAQTCRLLGSSGIYGTEDGGATWQKQAMEGRQAFPANLHAISCPALDTCYAEGGEDILATHQPG